MTDWEARVAELEHEVRVLRDEKAALEASAASASELITAMNDEIDSLRAQQQPKDEEKEEEGKEKEELDKLRKELEEARATIAQLQEAATKTATQTATPTPTGDARTVATLQSQVVVLRRRVAEARKAQQDTEALAAGLAADAARVPALERALTAAQEALAALPTQVERLSTAELRTRLQEEQARAAALAEDAAALRRALEDATAHTKDGSTEDADAQQQHVARLCVARADAESACRRCRRELAAARAELAAWRADTLAQYVAQQARTVPRSPEETQARTSTAQRLAALFRGSSSSAATSGEQLPEGFVAQVQDVLGTTLLKNAQLQHDILAIAEECDKLTARVRELEAAQVQ